MEEWSSRVGESWTLDFRLLTLDCSYGIDVT